MAVLSDANLKLYKKYVTDLQTQVNAWKTYLSTASSAINKGTGSTFRTEYAKGKKATENIQAIIDILQSLQGDLNKLIADANAYYNTSVKASKK